MVDVVITGIGLLTPIGDTLDELETAVRTGASGAAGEAGPHGPRVMARVKSELEEGWARRDVLTLDRSVMLALRAAEAAMHDADLSAADALVDARAGIIIGNACGPITSLQESMETHLATGSLHRHSLLKCLNNAAASQIAIRWGLRASCLTVSAECASSGVALHQAFNAIQRGEADVMLSGGTEAPLGTACYAGWEALGAGAMAAPDAASPSNTSRPFAVDRNGFVLGEGAVIFVLETEQRAKARGAKVLGRLLGSGLSSDARHPLVPHHPGQSDAMRNALANATLAASDIQYINAHGTATKVGDVSETRAMHQVFGAHAQALAISSTKPLHGHLLGASSAVELAVTLAALRGGFVPPTINLEQQDPECDLDYVALNARDAPTLRYAMSNSFGFGGTNASLVVGRA